jgi:hypothetical protein
MKLLLVVISLPIAVESYNFPCRKRVLKDKKHGGKIEPQ